MKDIYDGIIPGAGHNSLVLQSDPGRAGLDVVCLERRPEPGGGLATVEDPRHPGFRHHIAMLLASSGKAQMCLWAVRQRWPARWC